jgi:hypothetical protein
VLRGLLGTAPPRHIANDMTERRDHNGNATNMPRKVFV